MSRATLRTRESEESQNPGSVDIRSSAPGDHRSLSKSRCGSAKLGHRAGTESWTNVSQAGLGGTMSLSALADTRGLTHHVGNKAGDLGVLEASGLECCSCLCVSCAHLPRPPDIMSSGGQSAGPGARGQEG
eukprot:293771-Rhodomonas_salina.2